MLQHGLVTNQLAGKDRIIKLRNEKKCLKESTTSCKLDDSYQLLKKKLKDN